MIINSEIFDRLQNVDKIYAKEILSNQILTTLKEIKAIKKMIENGEYFNLTAVTKSESLTITIDKGIAITVLEGYLKKAEKSLEILEDTYKKL